jgi:hypothetical protein
MISAIVEGILEFLFHLIIEVICFYTGEIVIYILTLGKKKPRWDYYANYANASPSKFVALTELSVLVGMASWILLIALIANYLIS